MNRYRDIDLYTKDSGKRYRRNAIYPNIPESEDDVYIITSISDRYDTLALQFYNDSSLWWIIAMANNSERSSLIVEPGVQLRIPANNTEVIQEYNRINRIR